MKIPRFVTPEGNLVHQTKKIGMRMGNRGKLGPIMLEKLQPHASGYPWITCLLEKDGRRLEKPDPPVKYTHLFFLDEVTAFAAGHRPCGYGPCQQTRYKLFVQYWDEFAIKKTDDMDADLIAECCNDDGTKKTFDLMLGDLPSGSMFRSPDDCNPCLKLDGFIFPWTKDGYDNPISCSRSSMVQVLTPQSIVQMLKKGFPLLDSDGSVFPSPSITGRMRHGS